MIAVPSRRWFLVAAALAGAAPLAAWWPAAAGGFLLLDALWLLALLIDTVRAPGPAAIRVRRDAPLAFALGRPAPVRYRWQHGGAGRLDMLVREGLPGPLGGANAPRRHLLVPPGSGTEEQLLVRPIRRGTGAGGTLSIRVLGPLGLAWRQSRLELPWTATVYPAAPGTTLRALPLQVARRREAGLRAIRRPGEGRLFEGLREWVPGDETRIIDWKATARRGKTIARQYEDERRQQVLLMIDAGRLLTAEVEGVARLEAVIVAALHLARAAAEHDDNIGLMVFADTVQRYVAPARGRRALRAVLDGLAAAEGRLVESDYPGAFRYLATRNRKRALTVLFTDVIDRTASDALVAHAATLRPRHLPLAVTLRDPALEALATARPSGVTTAFERAAAEELLGARDAALAQMRARGIMVLDVPPASAGKAVVERYYQLKRRGML
ncbi:MAG TPA: DUF58 domain-containing protein [Gemmatimonadales bacterium]|nr:DUF58 domain-containing protein [Gemmatimonadales bacterium]